MSNSYEVFENIESKQVNSYQMESFNNSSEKKSNKRRLSYWAFESSEVPEKKQKNFKDEHCVICLEEWSSNEMETTLECGHIFHNSCLTQLIIHQKDLSFCSLCRDLLTDQDKETILNNGLGALYTLTNPDVSSLVSIEYSYNQIHPFEETVSDRLQFSRPRNAISWLWAKMNFHIVAYSYGTFSLTKNENLSNARITFNVNDTNTSIQSHNALISLEKGELLSNEQKNDFWNRLEYELLNSKYPINVNVLEERMVVQEFEGKKYNLLKRVTVDRTEEYLFNYKRHRFGNLPAVIRSDGIYEYWNFGKMIKEEVYDKETENLYGNKKWFKDGNLHRDSDLPAFINTYGTKIWFKNGVIYRDGDLPAIIHNLGTQEWYKNGLKHRDGDLPAVIYNNGSQEWYKNGKKHRDGDLPAAVSSSGTKKWFITGELHREGDLPAIIHSDGTQKWYKNGRKHRDGDLPAFIEIYGTQKWFKNGQLHRDEDLPAIIHSDGTQEWYKNGKCHRDRDLPAFIENGGRQIWYRNGLIHRDGDLPAIIEKDGTKIWYKKGQMHRDGNLPAFISSHGYKMWYKRGESHFENDILAIVNDYLTKTSTY
jgi:antitoxin component YwqK of YwqJK toxin-antitoxin module